jgi:hypothetical protein
VAEKGDGRRDGRGAHPPGTVAPTLGFREPPARTPTRCLSLWARGKGAQASPDSHFLSAVLSHA